MARTENYRKRALRHYGARCTYCGFGIEAVLEVAHLDGDRGHNELDNLAVLCPTCHRMHDIDLIPTSVIIQMRDVERSPRWAKLQKDAGKKAAATRKRRAAASRAAATRPTKKS
jgi:5-methylcytosine-specific restriction endonuclease McrA